MGDSIEARSPEKNSGRRILVVAQDLTLRERLYDILIRSGYSVKTVHSGEGALTSLQHERPDLILADSNTTDCGGWGLPDRVREFDTDLPIILVGTVNKGTLDVRTQQDVQECVPNDVPESALIQQINRCFMTAQLPKGNLYSGTALLVDDEPELLYTLQKFLEARGCRVRTASSGEEALACVRQSSLTLVLLDIKMPGMDGLVTLKKLKELAPKLPVIMATAVEDEALMNQAFALGAHEYIAKPYNLRALQAILLHLSTILAQD